VRGDDLLSVIRPLVASPASAVDWKSRYYHGDGIGSIRRLTDESGAITDGYTHSAFGELLSHTGSDPQPYAFTAEPFDANVGLAYHRQRWLDARVGRFVGMDPFAGNAFDPPTLHKYLYVASDPVSKVDPSGREYTLASLTTVSGILTAINVISQVHFAAVLGYRVGTLGLGVYEETLTVEEALDEAKDLGTEAAINLFLNFGVPAISASVVRKLGNLGLIRLFNSGKINGRLAEHYVGNAYGMLRNVASKIGQYTPDFINDNVIREIKNVSELRWSGRIARQLTAYATEAAGSGRQFYVHVRSATKVDPRVLAGIERIFGPNTRGVLWDIVTDIPEALRVVP
jgi:RHS repeat-associated protein